MTPEPVVVQHESPGDLVADVATRFLELLADLQAGEAVPHVMLTGGTIADEIHREIARLAAESGVDWGAVEFWWGDERFVAADSPDRNAGQARSAFLDAVGASRVHEMPASDGGMSLEEAASSYTDEVRASGTPIFDLVMLGMGPDGHVASLFPGNAALDAETVAVAVPDSPKPPPERVSLTVDTLNHTRRVWFVVSGADKAPAADRAIAGDQTLPAGLVHGSHETLWFRA